MSVLDELAPLKAQVETRLTATLDTLVDGDARPPRRLVDAMRHSLLAGGKRIRPLLTLCAAQSLSADAARAIELAWPAALAVELVHTYSLIHDDLPALDNDALRRGKPTLHIAFDEATAILAGDALLTDAFALLAGAEQCGARQCRELALAAGSAGMVGGQMVDIMSQGRPIHEVDVAAIHRKKTGRLIIGAVVLGALAVDAPEAEIARMRQYGAHLGLAFQITDDILDVVGDVGARGKNQGGDVEQDKATFVKLHGLEGAQALAQAEVNAARALVQPLGPRAQPLVGFAEYVAGRQA